MRLQRRSSAFLLCFALCGGVLAAAGVAAQELKIPDVVYPNLPKRAASAEGFVPQGWVLEVQASGDLNRDGIADMAFVLRQNDRKNVIENIGLGESPFNTNPRILAVAFRNGPVGDYVLQVENNTLIPRHVDPLDEDYFGDNGLNIERGGLRVILSAFRNAGGWDTFTVTHIFQYRNDHFELIGFDRAGVHRASGKTNDISVNYLSGRMKLATGYISRDDPSKVTWKTLPRRERLTLDAVGNGLAFDPER
ncbi:hypothetical protein [Microvirga flavescens]|uniref:hypothetical protein n=1 Tax=Microvirga flavescens TaxID=2249811 RepID=UPI0013006A00|nr:hypothetical protein [Microvirga flavescens]